MEKQVHPYERLVIGGRLIIAKREATPELNIAKIAEETGELARTRFHPHSRENFIEEVADVIIAAAAHGSFVQMTAYELEDAIARKIKKAIALQPVPVEPPRKPICYHEWVHREDNEPWLCCEKCGVNLEDCPESERN